MNMDIIRIEFDADGHPDETALYLALEGEVSEQDAARIEAHARTCPLCQARRAEVAQGFAVYDEYRKTVLLPELEIASDIFPQNPTRLRELYRENETRIEVPKRISKFRRWLFGDGAPIRWVTVTAGLTAAIVFVTQVLWNPVRLSAAELLDRAAASQNPSGAQFGRGKGKKVHQKVRISGGGTSVIRDFQWTTGSAIPDSRWGNEKNPVEWLAPLTAEGFSEWRNSLVEKNDKVERTGSHWTLDTITNETTTRNSIREAWIVMRASDFHPTEQHIRFVDDRSLDFEEVAFELADDQAASKTVAAQNSVPQLPVAPGQKPAQQAADPNEAEMEVRYAMFQREWDLGEDLEIARTGNDVTVTGTASSQQRAEGIREALGQIAGVRLAISAPPATAQAGGSPGPRDAPLSANPAALLKEVLENNLPVLEQRRDFVDRCLSAADNAMAHASAAQNLAERYDAAAEAYLTPASDARLYDMLRAHLERLRLADSELDLLMQFLSTPASARVATANNWREAIQSLFAQVREQDSLVAALVAGSQSVRLDVRTASARVKSLHESIQILLANARTLLSAPDAAK